MSLFNKVTSKNPEPAVPSPPLHTSNSVFLQPQFLRHLKARTVIRHASNNHVNEHDQVETKQSVKLVENGAPVFFAGYVERTLGGVAFKAVPHLNINEQHPLSHENHTIITRSSEAEIIKKYIDSAYICDTVAKTGDAVGIVFAATGLVDILINGLPRYPTL